MTEGKALLEVQRRMCQTCIYRKESLLDLRRLEAEVADPQMPGFFRGYRACHHAPPRRKVVCAGFWRRHKLHFTLGQIAIRLKRVVFVTVDQYTRKPGRAHE